MADTPARVGKAFLSVRIVEWSLLAVLLSTLVVVFLNRVYVVQRQAELAAVQSLLGSLRTAFVLQHLHQATGQNRAGDVLRRNPFELLQQRPFNYWVQSETGTVTEVPPPGHWVFDAACVCVGYRPADATAFDSPSGDTMAWYRVEQPQAGPLLLTPKERYVWQGQVLN
ncbi:MAG: hypothetical protein COW02_02210 [Comamonadaceae bacterium CG12_big_fil_rev_8_21_14_0_65_59_15]|nr:MAG: hypothetical protein COW02_02210 [Comamonadaceae bacterium CG12_big_fil_rev_8_21_14_0_65_59_15]